MHIELTFGSVYALMLFYLMDFPIQLNAIMIGSSIIYIKGSQVGISKL